MVSNLFDITQTPELAFVLNQTFQKFMEKWPSHLDKMIMIEIWASKLSKSSVRVEHIKSATTYCVENLDRWPSVNHFRIYCERAAKNESLSNPIISESEELAVKILNSLIEADKSFDNNLHNYLDAFLIGALVIQNRLSSQSGASFSSKVVKELFVSKIGLLTDEFNDRLRSIEKSWLKNYV